MGKFTGLLLASDYDNTLTYTEEALRLCQPMPPVPDANQEAIRYFMSEGGIFSVATGRAKPAFERVAADVPMNGPTILFNGAAIYDFPTGKYLCEAFLPDEAKDCIQQVIGALPFSAVELYHDNNDIHALQPNDVTRRHLHITHSPTVFVDSMTEVPSPISKALFSTEPENQPALLDFLRAQPWYDRYEIVASSSSLVELTAKGANKGGMVRRLAELLGIRQVFLKRSKDSNFSFKALAKTGSFRRILLYLLRPLIACTHANSACFAEAIIFFFIKLFTYTPIKGCAAAIHKDRTVKFICVPYLDAFFFNSSSISRSSGFLVTLSASYSMSTEPVTSLILKVFSSSNFEK